jgi:predicted acylesterase/phospholipase RssA
MPEAHIKGSGIISETKQIHAFVLSGSGADSAYQVGVLKALVNGSSTAAPKCVEPRVVAATSTGALNAAFLASEWEHHGPRAVDSLERLWTRTLSSSWFGDGAFRVRLNPLDLLRLDMYSPGLDSIRSRLAADVREMRRAAGRVAEILISGEDVFERLSDLFDISLLLGSEPLRQAVTESIDFDRIHRSSIRLEIATTNWETGELCYFRNGGRSGRISPDVVLAAGAIPGYFPAEKVAGWMNVDCESQVIAPLRSAVRQVREFVPSDSGTVDYQFHVIYTCARRNEMPSTLLESMLQTHYGSQVISWDSRVGRDLKRVQRINQGIVMCEDLAALEGYEVCGAQEPETEAISRIRERVASMPVRERQGLLATGAAVVKRLQDRGEWRKMTIHRYFPSQGLDSKLGFLDFRRSRVERLIAQGFTDAANHDCQANQCIHIAPGPRRIGRIPSVNPVSKSPQKPSVHALIFSGGGAYGAYQVGCARALIQGHSAANGKTPLEPDVFAGTSVGAFNSSFLVSKWHSGGPEAVSSLENAWTERIPWNGGANGAFRVRLTPLELLYAATYGSEGVLRRILQNYSLDTLHLLREAGQRALGLFKLNEPLLDRLSACVDLSVFVGPEPWEDTIRALIDFEKIRESSRRLTIAVTNWPRGVVSHFTNQSVSPDAIRASSAIPGFYPPATVDGQVCVDGAVLMNTPLNRAIRELREVAPRAGESEFVLHVVYINPRVEKSSTPQGTLQTLFRSQAIQWGSSVEIDINNAQSLNKGLSMIINKLIALGKDPGAQLSPGELDLVREAVSSRPAAEAQALFETSERIMQKREIGEPYQLLTIHRYFPRTPISGAFGFMDVRQTTIENLIQQGFEDTVNHDCAACGCVLAQEQAGAAA